MIKLLAFFKRFDYPTTTHTFGLFRILYAAYNLGLIFQLYSNWPLYFDHVAPLSLSFFPVKLCLLMWSVANLLLITGTFTRYAAIANYVFVVMMASYFTNIKIASFNDDLLRIGGFLLIFLPAAKSFSIDAVINRFYHKEPKHTTSYLYYLLTILVSLGLLYFASAISKMFSPMWQKGIGLWIPAVIPSYKWNTFSFWVDEQWLMYTLNYTVILFELLFVWLLFNKKFHIFLALIGIGFHLGIALLFPFYYISFGPIFYYVLFIPDAWWTHFKHKWQLANPMPIVFNPTIPKHVHATQLLRAFNYRGVYHFIEKNNQDVIVFGTHGGWQGFSVALEKSLLLFPVSMALKSENLQNVAEYVSENWLPQSFIENTTAVQTYRLKRFVFFVFIAGLCGVQFLSLSYHAYTAIKADPQKRARYLQQRVALQDFSTKPSNLARTLFGINSRGVFLDHAFTGSKTVFALARVNGDGTEEWLPVFNKEGYCVGDNIGFRWHKLSFKYFGRTQTQPDTIGFEKYTLLWAKSRNISLNNIDIRVYRRIYPCPTAYETGYLTKMLALPWDTAGVIHWKDSVFTYENLKPDTVFNQ